MISLPIVREKILENLGADLTWTAPPSLLHRYTRTTFHCTLQKRVRLMELLSMMRDIFPFYETGSGPYPPTNRAMRQNESAAASAHTDAATFYSLYAQNEEVAVTIQFVYKQSQNGSWFVKVNISQCRLYPPLREIAATTFSRIFQTAHLS